MSIPRGFIDELVQRADIEEVVGRYVPLTRKGANLWGLCPFHSEKTASFSVSPDKQIYYCFGCGKGGGVLSFLMEMEHLNFVEAVQQLADRLGVEVPEEEDGDREWRRRRERTLELNKKAARFYYEQLSQPQGAAVADYIAQRRISRKFALRFGLGAAPDAWDSLLRAMAGQGYEKAELIEAGLAVAGKNGGVYDKFRNRLMLPVIDLRGNVIGFTSRVMDNSAPKYLNTPETALFRKRSTLYGLNFAKATKRDSLLLVEGNIDVITLHQAGFDNAVATMGTALTEEHIHLLGRYTKQLVLCYDNDAAGLDATQRAIGLLKNTELSVRVLQLPRRRTEGGELVKQDADDFIKYQGAAAFETLLGGSADQTAYRLEVIQNKYDLTADDQRAAFLQETATMLAGLDSPVEREIYGNRAATAAGLSGETMAQEVEKARRSQGRRARRQEERRAMTPADSFQPSQRQLRYQNVRSARAEEGIIRLLLLDSGLFPQAEELQEDEFSSPFLSKLFRLLKERWQAGEAVAIPALSADLSTEEMSRLVQLAQAPETGQQKEKALADYIERVRSEAAKQRSSGYDRLLAVREQKRKKTMEDDVL
ncbi:MAG: DNA primase [Oscillospiraceae bacterium]|nr:DNA primase [Oscillospiraceae bacterium]